MIIDSGHQKQTAILLLTLALTMFGFMTATAATTFIEVLPYPDLELGTVTAIALDPGDRWWVAFTSSGKPRVGIVDKAGIMTVLPEPPQSSAITGLAFDPVAHSVYAAAGDQLLTFQVDAYAWQATSCNGAILKDLYWTRTGLVAATEDAISIVTKDKKLSKLEACRPADSPFLAEPGKSLKILTRDKGILTLSETTGKLEQVMKATDSLAAAKAFVLAAGGDDYILTSDSVLSFDGTQTKVVLQGITISGKSFAGTRGERAWLAGAEQGLKLTQADGSTTVYGQEANQVLGSLVTTLTPNQDGDFLLVGGVGGVVLVQTESAEEVRTAETVTTSSYKVKRHPQSTVLATRFALPRPYTADIRSAYFKVLLPAPEGTIVEPLFETDSHGNTHLLISGDYEWIAWKSHVLERYQKKGALNFDTRAAMKIQQNPVETLVYTENLPGLPPSDAILPKIMGLIRPSSRGDAYRVIRDFLYSDYFVNPTTKNELVDLSNIRMRGLFSVALFRAFGFPTRLVSIDLERMWGEIWINDVGWVPYDMMTAPAQFWSSNRVQFPAATDEFHVGVHRIAPRDEVPGFSLLTSNQLPPEVQRLWNEEVDDVDSLEHIRLVVIRPSTTGEIPPRARLAISKNCAGFIYTQSDKNYFSFFTTENRQVLNIPMANYGRAQMLNTPEAFYLEFIPASVSEWLLMKVMRWQVLDRDKNL